MILEKTFFDEVFIIKFSPNFDDRGFFYRTYDKNIFLDTGHSYDWVQMNHSFTKKKGTIRGLHSQFKPFDETKFVRCISGKIFDVIVDIRKDSKTYLKWQGFELSHDNFKGILIPSGFAHGFQTLVDNTELIYLHSQYFNSNFEFGLNYRDPKINIKWPLNVTNISLKDSSYNFL